MEKSKVMHVYNPKEFRRTNESHKQEIVAHDGHAYFIDTKLVTLLKAAWSVGIKTRFSCQNMITKIDNDEPYFQLAFTTPEDFKHFLSVVDSNFSKKSNLHKNLWNINSEFPWIYDITVFTHETCSKIEMMYFVHIPVRDKNALVAKFNRMVYKKELSDFTKMRKITSGTRC